MTDILDLVYNFLINSAKTINPIFIGDDWRSSLFQAYAIIVPAFASVYSIISAQKSSAMILSHGRLRLATAMIGAVYFGLHQLLIHVAPWNSGHGIRAVFVVVAWLGIIVIPYLLGYMITNLINRLEDGPFLIVVDEQPDDGNRFWRPGPNLVRRVAAQYYVSGLLFPSFFLFSMPNEDARMQLAVLVFWMIVSVGLLVKLTFRDPRFIKVLAGYLLLVYVASK